MKTISFYFLLSSIVLISTWSCKSRQVHPQEPEVISRTHFIKDEISTFYLPIEVSLNKAEKTINNLFTDVIYKDESYTNNNNDDLKLIIRKLKNIRIDAKGNILTMTLPLGIWVKARQNLLGIELTQDMNFDATLTFDTEVDIDENWNIKTKTSNFNYKYLTEPVMNLGGISLPMNGVVSQILDKKVADLLPMVDEYITETVNFRHQVDSVWKSTQYPINIDKEYNSWVKLRPTKFILSPIESKNRKLKTAIGFESFIEVITGNTENEKLHNNPLPKLSKVAIPSDQFHIALSSELSYIQLSTILQKELIGFTYQDKKRTIKVTDISSYGNGDDIVFRLNFEGDVEGELFASGRPAYDTVRKELYIENFDFDIHTKKTLLKAANWLLHGTFKKQVQKHMRFSLKDEFDNIAQLIEESLIENTLGEGLHINCDILDIYPRDISLTDFSIKTLIIIDGKANVRYGR